MMMKNILVVALFLSSILISCNSSNTKNSETKSDVEKVTVDNATVIKEGKKIAMGTFKILSGKLKMAIKSGGPVAGIDVCSSEAMKLTDSISKVYNVSLKRISLKNRNEKNVPSDAEKKILESWQTQIDAGSPIKPNIIRNDNEITFVGPIKVKHQCIVCHGSDDFVSPDVRLKLKEHYPNDKARNYNEGDLRGAWIITFPNDYFVSN